MSQFIANNVGCRSVCHLKVSKRTDRHHLCVSFEVIFIDQRSFNSMSREVPIKDGTIEPNESGMLPEGGMTIPQMRAFIQKQVNCNLA